MSTTVKKILGVVAIIAILFLGYYFFGPKNTGTQDLLTSASGTTVDGGTTPDAPGQDFLSQLLNLNTIKLDSSLLTSSAFGNLQDYSITLTQTEGNQGRQNPFAPIGSDAGNVTQTTIDNTPIDGTQFPSTVPTNKTIKKKAQ